MKKLIYFALAICLLISCAEKNEDKKDFIYAEKHKVYSTKDSIFSGITVYYAKVQGHDVVYNVFSGKNKAQMDVLHFEDAYTKCKKAKNVSK